MISRLRVLFYWIIDVLKIERKHLPVFFFLVALSTIFWVLTVLSKDYTSTIHYNVKFVDFPKDKLLVEHNDIELLLQVNAPGFALLAHKFKFKKELPLSVNGFIPTKQGDIWNYFWLGEQSLSEVQEQISKEMQLLHIQPNRIDLLLDEKAERLIPIKLKSKISYEPMFRKKDDIQLEPSSITIIGPEAVVEIFDDINTDLLEISNVNINQTGKLNLELFDNSDISYSQTEISYDLKVEQYTQGSIEMDIKVLNIPRGYKIKLFPDKVLINYSISLDNFDLVKKEMFELSSTFDKTKKRLSVKVDRKPDFVENIRLFPPKVEYILIKN